MGKKGEGWEGRTKTKDARETEEAPCAPEFLLAFARLSGQLHSMYSLFSARDSVEKHVPRQRRYVEGIYTEYK